MNKVKLIIDKLATELNIFDIIELSTKMFIDLTDYIDLFPKIYINYDSNSPISLDDNQYYEWNILDIGEFTLNDNTHYKIYRDSARKYRNLDVYLQNIENVKFILFNPYLDDYQYCYVTDGDMNTTDDTQYRSIEYKFHNYNGVAFEDGVEKFYAINEKVLTEEEFKNTVRKEKLKSITNG